MLNYYEPDDKSYSVLKLCFKDPLYIVKIIIPFYKNLISLAISFI